MPMLFQIFILLPLTVMSGMESNYSLPQGNLKKSQINISLFSFIHFLVQTLKGYDAFTCLRGMSLHFRVISGKTNTQSTQLKQSHW